MKSEIHRLVAFVALVSLLAGCKSKQEEAKPSPSAAPSSPPIASVVPENQKVDRVIRLPSGPVLEIIPGQGVGAIRLGATVETIERLMGKPCEFKTDQACRYVGRGVEFFLDDKGITNEIRIHRVERPTTPEGRTFGVFNGRMANGMTLMMLPVGVRGLIGPPLKTEPITSGGPAHTVQLDTYDGMRVEYDEIAPGKLVVGGIIIVKSDKSPAPAPSAGKPKAKAKPLH